MCVGILASVTLFIANAFLALCGIAITVIGVMSKVAPNSVVNLLNDINIGQSLWNPSDLVDTKIIFNDSAIILLSFGGILLGVAVFGGCSAICGGICRIVYALILLALIVAHLGVIIYLGSTSGHQNFKDQVSEAMRPTFEKYKITHEKVTNESIDLGGLGKTELSWFYFQSEQSCCGIINYTDHNPTEFPPSCCQLKEQGSVGNTTKDYNEYKECIKPDSTKYKNIKGCLEPVYSSLTLGPQLAIILCAVSLLIQVGCAMLVVLLMG